MESQADRNGGSGPSDDEKFGCVQCLCGLSGPRLRSGEQAGGWARDASALRRLFSNPLCRRTNEAFLTAQSFATHRPASYWRDLRKFPWTDFLNRTGCLLHLVPQVLIFRSWQRPVSATPVNHSQKLIDRNQPNAGIH